MARGRGKHGTTGEEIESNPGSRQLRKRGRTSAENSLVIRDNVVQKKMTERRGKSGQSMSNSVEKIEDGKINARKRTMELHAVENEIGESSKKGKVVKRKTERKNQTGEAEGSGGEIGTEKKLGKTVKRKSTENVKDSKVKEPVNKRKKVTEKVNDAEKPVRARKNADTEEIKTKTPKRQSVAKPAMPKKSVSPVKKTAVRKSGKKTAVVQRNVSATSSPAKKVIEKKKTAGKKMVDDSAKKTTTTAQKKKPAKGGRRYIETREKKKRRIAKLKETYARYRKSAENDKKRHEERVERERLKLLRMKPRVNPVPAPEIHLKAEVEWTLAVPLSHFSIAVGHRITVYGHDNLSGHLLQYDGDTGRELQHIVYGQDRPDYQSMKEVEYNGKQCLAVYRAGKHYKRGQKEDNSDKDLVKFLDLYDLNKQVGSHRVTPSGRTKEFSPDIPLSAVLPWKGGRPDTYLDCRSATPEFISTNVDRWGPSCFTVAGDKHLIVRCGSSSGFMDELFVYYARTGSVVWERSFPSSPDYTHLPEHHEGGEDRNTYIYLYIDENKQLQKVADVNPRWLPGMTRTMHSKSVASDGHGHLFVADSENKCIQVFNVLDGKYLGVLAWAEECRLGDLDSCDIYWSEPMSALIVKYYDEVSVLTVQPKP